MNWDLGPGENQLYVKGEWKLEARWPNVDYYQTTYPGNTRDERKAASAEGISFDYFDKFDAVPRIQEPVLEATYRKVKISYADGGSHRGNSPTPGIFQCRIPGPSALKGKPRDYWKGTIYYDPGWWYGSGIQIASSWDESDTLRFTLETRQIRWGGQGCFIGHRDFIDQDYEWALKDGFIYMQIPAGVDPNRIDIRAKKTPILFNCNNRNRIVLQNINFHGGTVQLDSAYYCEVDNCHFKYLSHHRLMSGNGNLGDPEPGTPLALGMRGIVIGGANNKFINSSIEYSASMGLNMRGGNNLIHNNYMRVISYFNSYASCVHSPKAGDMISNNTFWIVGRSAINGASGGTVTRNIFRDCMALSGDGGVLYTWGNYPLNMDISYNWFDNVLGRPSQYLYCDAAAYAYTVHHNLFMPSVSSRFFALACQGGEFFNNTWVCPQYMYGPFENQYDKYFKSVDSWGLSMNDLVGTKDTKVDTAYWKFNSLENRDFTLREGSPAIDAGTEIPFITDGFVGDAPDLGAYEYGKKPWVPGHTWGEMISVSQLWNTATLQASPIISTGSYQIKRMTPVSFNAHTASFTFDKAHYKGIVEVFNYTGQLVFSRIVKNTREKLYLPAGSYCWKFTKGDASVIGRINILR